jgi:hypothetical protein
MKNSIPALLLTFPIFFTGCATSSTPRQLASEKKLEFLPPLRKENQHKNLLLMTYRQAVSYCMNPAKVKQPGHLPTIREWAKFIDPNHDRIIEIDVDKNKGLHAIRLEDGNRILDNRPKAYSVVVSGEANGTADAFYFKTVRLIENFNIDTSKFWSSSILGEGDTAYTVQLYDSNDVSNMRQAGDISSVSIDSMAYVMCVSESDN